MSAPLILPDNVYRAGALKTVTVTAVSHSLLNGTMQGWFNNPSNKNFGVIPGGINVVYNSTNNIWVAFITYIDYTPIDPAETRLTNNTALSTQPIYSS